MSTEQPASPTPGPHRNKLLIIIGSAIIVLLAIIAIAVSSQSIRASDEAAAKESAVAEASKMVEIAKGEKTLADQKAADAAEANHVCEEQVLKKHPTAAFEAGKTISTFNAFDSSYETVGYYTDDALYGNSIPMQFICSSTNGSGTSWDVILKAIGRQ